MNPKKKKLLATGHVGFVGKAMQVFVEALHPEDVQWCPPEPDFDLLDPGSIARSIERHAPDWIVHLAAQSHVPTSWEDPARTLQVNAGGTASLLKTLSDLKFQGRLLFVSSADIYGAVPESDLPVTEERLPAPRNPYASSKVAGEVLCRQWLLSHPLDVVIARPFNHTGPGQRPDFALPSFAREVVAIQRGDQPTRLVTGDLTVSRDFLDVRDVVAAYLALLAKGQRGETYNVCSGREVVLADALRQLLQIAAVRVETVIDPSRIRPQEQRRMCGNFDKLRQATDWQPQIPLHETLASLIGYWHTELSR